MKIIVHGSTGAQGAPVAAALRAAGHDVVGITRKPSNADSVAADIEDQASLEAAYAGADGVFVHLPIPSSPEDPVRWVPNILGALANSDVERVVASTSGASLADAGPHPMMQGRLLGTKAFYEGLRSVAESVVGLAPRLYLENFGVVLVRRCQTMRDSSYRAFERHPVPSGGRDNQRTFNLGD